MIRGLASLLRLRLALLNGVATMGGYLLFPAKPVSLTLCAAFSGVTLLAAAASVLNQVLERDLDRRMVRTRLRLLPSGGMKPLTAMIIAGMALIAGLLLLASAGGHMPVSLGAAALVWYLAVYTPLKQRSSCAPIVGALCGALPPVIGWCMAGGSADDYRIIFLAGLLFLWQIPHVWLFQRRHADDFRNAGIPLLGETSEQGGLPGFFAVWITALTAAAMLLPAFGIIGRNVAIWYAFIPVPLVVLTILRTDRILFSYLNLFPFMVTLALSVRTL